MCLEAGLTGFLLATLEEGREKESRILMEIWPEQLEGTGETELVTSTTQMSLGGWSQGWMEQQELEGGWQTGNEHSEPRHLVVELRRRDLLEKPFMAWLSGPGIAGIR